MLFLKCPWYVHSSLSLKVLMAKETQAPETLSHGLGMTDGKDRKRTGQRSLC